jgi:hypothetical protein
MSVLKSKFSKLSSQKLLGKLEKKQGTDEELIIMREILVNRGALDSTDQISEEGQVEVLTPEQIQEVEGKITQIIEANHRPTLTKLLELLGGVEDYEKLSEEQVKSILKLKIGEEPVAPEKPVKPVIIEKPSASSKPKENKKVLTSQLSTKDSEEITKALEPLVLERANKKTIITTLLKAGFTKQQLDKYTPAIAHWTYIYDISDKLDL